MVKLYVAGYRAQDEQIHENVEELRSLGYNVPYDWTKVDVPRIPTPETLARLANRAALAVKEADIVLAMLTCSSYHYPETFTEIGMALATGKPVIALCYRTAPDEADVRCRGNCFFWADGIEHCFNWFDMLKALSRQTASLRK